MAATAMPASSAYRMPLPCLVDTGYLLPGRRPGVTASPLGNGPRPSSRGTTPGNPVGLPLDAGGALCIRIHTASIEYRRRLPELPPGALSGSSGWSGEPGVSPMTGTLSVMSSAHSVAWERHGWATRQR
jgi:hypothetical protein